MPEGRRLCGIEVAGGCAGTAIGRRLIRRLDPVTESYSAAIRCPMPLRSDRQRLGRCSANKQPVARRLRSYQVGDDTTLGH